MRELSLDPDPQIAAALDLLAGCGVFSRTTAGNGFVPAALDSILNQPDVHFRSLVAGRAVARKHCRRQSIRLPRRSPALPSISRGAALTSRYPARRGRWACCPWSLTAFTTAGGAFGGELRLGEPGACLRFNLDPLTATIECPRLGQATPEIIPAWPAPDVSRLVAELPSILVAGAVRLGLDYLRELDVTAKPIIDAALDALGLLSGSLGDEVRSARVPLAFLSDPAAYFVSPAAFGGGAGSSRPPKRPPSSMR